MKKLFNNPWVVGCLGICSLAYLGFSIMGPLMSEDAFASPTMDAEVPSMAGNPGELLSFEDASTNHTIDKTGIVWLEDLNRDPFAGESQSAVASDATSPPPQLNAIFSGENTHMAVVNQQLVREGDKIGVYRVKTIKRTEVILMHKGDLVILDSHL